MISEPLFADERTRAAELYVAYAQLTADRLAKRYGGVDPQRIADAVVEAILGASREWPATEADPKRRLAEHARQILRTLLRGDVRRRKREREHLRSNSAPLTLDDRELAHRLRQEIIAHEGEERVLELWLQGHTNPAKLAELLGGHEQEVAAVLARLRQRIHRLNEKVARDA